MDATFYCFGPFRLYPSEQLLLHGREPIALAPKTFEVLLALVASDGALMTRDTLMQMVWPRGYVEEINLTVNVSLLRKALGTLPDGTGYIATVPKRGYRFKAPVTLASAEIPADLAPAAAPPEARADAVIAAENPVNPGSAVPCAPPRTAIASPLLRKGWPSAALRWSLLTLVTFAALSGSIWYVQPRVAPSAGSPAAALAIHTLAVLPFELISDHVDDAYLGLGITDALITRLSGQGALKIRPFRAVRRYAGSKDPAQAGAELHVEAVLDGTIQRFAEQTRVSVRLLRIDTGKIVWTESFDAQPEAAFALEDAISQRLSAALALELTADEQLRLSRSATHSRDAHDLYTKARVQLNSRNIASMRTSLDLFQQAIRADPDYAAAYAGLAHAYILTGTYSNNFPDPRIAAPRAKEAAEKAVTLDQASPEAHASLGYLRLTYDWDWIGAEQEFRHALDLNPADVHAHLWYAHELVALGRMDEARAESEVALDLAPDDSMTNELMAWYQLYEHQYAEAIAQATKTLHIDPDFARARHVLGLAYLYSGAYDKACHAFSTNLTQSHGNAVALAHLARCQAAAHRPSEARAILAGLEQQPISRYASPAEIATVHAALGDTDAALRWLDTACSERAGALIYLNVDPAFDSLRDEARFQAIVARVNLTRPPVRPPTHSPAPITDIRTSGTSAPVGAD